MKRTLISILLTVLSIGLFAQNTLKYEIRANGGLRVGGASKVKIDSIVLNANTIKLYNGTTANLIPTTTQQSAWDAAYAAAVTNAVTLTATSTELNWNKGQKSYAVEKADTTTLFAWNIGIGAASDTACFRTAYSYGGFYWDGADTLVVTKMIAVLTGSSPSVAIDIYWHSTFLSASATKLKTTAPTITSTTTGDATTSFDNYLIPPGVWVWCKTPTVTTQPKSMRVTIIGKKQNRKR
jgi:hypothetical protein